MDHTASVILLDSDGDFAGTIAYGENPDAALDQAEAAGGRRLTRRPLACTDHDDPDAPLLSTDSAGADRLFAALEAAFEEDGYPSRSSTLDEERGIQEISLYADGDADVCRAACAQC